jgi:hypothetical protein
MEVAVQLVADLVHRPLATTTANTNTVHHKALLGFVPHTTGFVRPGGPAQPDDAWQLTELPAAHTQEEAEHIALLLPPKLLHVLQTAD